MLAPANPLHSLRLACAFSLPWRLWDHLAWLRPLGISARREPDGKTLIRMGRRLSLVVPGRLLQDDRVIPAEYPSFVFQALNHFVAVALADQYDVCGVLQPGDTVLDIGANVGVFSLLASRLVGEHGRVLAVEPVPQNVECLKLMCQLNQLTNVEIIPVAAGDREGALSLTLADDMMGHSGKRHKTAESVEVPLTTIDALVASQGVDRVALVKLDIEGMEAEALTGGAATLATHRPRLAMAAYHYDDDEQRLPAVIRGLREEYQVSAHRFAPDLERVLIAS
jgi:FkbM family methyltransferase